MRELNGWEQAKAIAELVAALEEPVGLEDGLCREVDADTFFADVGENHKISAARIICGRCDVREACLEYALEHGERYGMWGGMTENQRRKLISARNKAKLIEYGQAL
jgi:WhiB family redox-sensing transcriptional regulator